MHRTIVPAIVVSSALLFSSAVQADNRSFDLGTFDQLDIASGIDAHITVGSPLSVRADGSAQALDNLKLTVKGDRLTARIEQSFLDFIISGGVVGMILNSGNVVSLEITVPSLTSITASSGADVKVSGVAGEGLLLDASSGADIEATNVRLSSVTMNVSSGADIGVDGRAQTVSASASSGSNIDAEDLEAEFATASASSGADISIHASRDIKARASSGGSIEVDGNPTKRDISESSGGSVRFDD